MCNFLLCLEEYSVYYSNEIRFCAPTLGLTTRLNTFYHTSDQMGIPCIKCVLEELWKTNSQNSQLTQVLKYLKYILPVKLTIKYCINVFFIQFSIALETVNPKIWCSKCFQNVNIQLKCFIFNIIHFNYICSIYIRFPEKNFTSLREIIREWFRTFRFRQHF